MYILRHIYRRMMRRSTVISGAFVTLLVVFFLTSNEIPPVSQHQSLVMYKMNKETIIDLY